MSSLLFGRNTSAGRKKTDLKSLKSKFDCTRNQEGRRKSEEEEIRKERDRKGEKCMVWRRRGRIWLAASLSRSIRKSETKETEPPAALDF